MNHHAIHEPRNFQLLKELRTYYPAEGNEVGALLDEIIKDVATRAPRKEVRADAEALLAKLPAASQAHQFIKRYLAMRKRGR